MASLIKFCKTNYCNGTDQIKEEVLSSLEVEIEEKECLGNCGQCYLESFVVVDDKFLVVNSYYDLMEKLN